MVRFRGQRNSEKGLENQILFGNLPFLTCIPFSNKNHTYNHTQMKKIAVLFIGTDICSNFFFLFPVEASPYTDKGGGKSAAHAKRQTAREKVVVDAGN